MTSSASFFDTPGLALVGAVLTLTLPVSSRADSSPPLRENEQLAAVELIELDRIDNSALLTEDRAKLAHRGPLRFATPIEIEIDGSHHGTWTDLDSGDHGWQLRIRSPDAHNINLWFSRFELPTGAALWLYSATDPTIPPAGPFDAGDANGKGQLWSPVVPGNEIVVEMLLPATSTHEPHLKIGAVNHGYRPLFANKQGDCNIDVACPEVDPYRDQTRAVARYTVSGTFMCTGTLLNRVAGDFAPIFLTAFHCGVDAITAPSVVTYWNYESPTCGQLGGGNLTNILTGASFLAGYFPADVTLLELDDTPPASWNPYYAGWDATTTGADSVIAIHHPSGEEKAVAFDDQPVVSVSLTELDPTETHWLVSEWERGTTESGSSGSCLFDRSNGRCLGVLTTGTASCDLPSGLDVFGQLAAAWDGGGTPETRLRDWLADGTSATSLSGADPDETNDDPPPPPNCVETETNLCLTGGRFEVTIDWVTNDGEGPAIASPLRTDDSGLFYFFSANNLEVLIKVLDGCSFNDHFWVFYGAATDVEFTVTVTDTSLGVVRTYSNAGGEAAAAVTDTSAFATCPSV